MVDEQHVLYNGQLRPRPNSQHNDPLFGVDVNSSQIECEIHTPDDLKAEKQDAG